MVVNIFSQRETEKAHTDFSSNGLMLYNIPKEQPPQSVGKSLIVCENPWRDADFWDNYPGLEKVKIRTVCYSCGSVTFGKFALSCVAALCVCARDGHRNTGSFSKKRPQDMPFPMPNAQTFRPRITQAKAVPGRYLDRPPHLRPQRGPAALLAMGDLHTQSRKNFGEG